MNSIRLELSRKIVKAINADPLVLQAHDALAKAGFGVWLVGGAIRDAWFGKPLDDVDFAVDTSGGDIFRFADQFAKSEGLSWFPLDRERGTVRIVARNPRFKTIDITRFQGGTLDADIKRRDFTVNSAAVSLENGQARITDPLDGAADLAEGILRLCSPTAFSEDPVRILRYHRFAQDYGLVPAPGLPEKAAASLDRLWESSAERIAQEFFRIIGSANSHPTIRRMAEDRSLDAVFPEIGPMRGVTQNQWHHLDVFEHTLQTYESLERLASNPPGWLPLGNWRSEDISTGVTRLMAAKLATLYHDTGKPESRAVKENGRVTFYGHEKIGADLSRKAARRLKAPKAVETGWTALTRYHLRPFNALRGGTVSKRAMFRFLRDLGDWWEAALFLTLADSDAKLGPAVKPENRQMEKETVLKIFDYRRSLMEKGAGLEPPVGGAEILERFGLEPGPKIGELLERAKEAAGTGEIEGKDEALDYIAGLLKKDGT